MHVLAGDMLRHDGDVTRACKADEELMLRCMKSQQRGDDEMQSLSSQAEDNFAVATWFMLNCVSMNREGVHGAGSRNA